MSQRRTLTLPLSVRPKKEAEGVRERDFDGGAKFVGVASRALLGPCTDASPKRLLQLDLRDPGVGAGCRAFASHFQPSFGRSRMLTSVSESVSPSETQPGNAGISAQSRFFCRM